MTSESMVAGHGERLVVVVAHPDVVAFGCGSLIALASAAGAHVTVSCATRGESGERRPDPVTHSWPLGLVREAELCHTGIVLGVDEVIILDYVDSGICGRAPEGALAVWLSPGRGSRFSLANADLHQRPIRQPRRCTQGYWRCFEGLRDQLGVAPDTETSNLHQRLNAT
jgi:LmbE family N-acetylglucosaminyl deacetylase